MEVSKSSSSNPLEHAKNIEEILSSLKLLCRSELHVFEDPKAKALLETSAEVLGGLEKAFHDFQGKGEGWKDIEPIDVRKSSDPWD